ncbi:MAG TPA: 1-(5-phosphoribosyl)-5-[(5-phosphoribosylamino)methylideneamino]imidazole-4-carboxamide isomerase [Saprospiraceae bacterium]|nr:1-(5-phosphoribosyl)-5-[(5-phosphoribosylamino)methylideneamino]imidazole-4-carboxamide isomerase [Saprospiraceae bacterium]HMP24827.1 1-(5-phosphoribosyl)-5-[(5-phosphoribosylamino)methylideneamino]imidazole-4-carboxamide isomerase [Saprospiraceae bacterium]
MHIIPAIDIIDGKCVRLTQGDYAQQKVYNENPVEVAKQFEAAGLTRLHVVDLDGARANRIVNHKVLEAIATQTNLWIDFGGGLKSDADVQIAFASGAKQITGGTVAVKNPELFLGWLEVYGPERIILGADVKDGKIAVSGWQEQSDADLFTFLCGYVEKNVQNVICTDISKDGLLQGSAIALYEEILQKFPNLKLVASGGVTSLAEIQKLRAIGCFGAIVGKAIYEGKLTLSDLVSERSGA